MKRNIENTTELKIPVLYGTVIPVRCFGPKLSGPDAVTCIENTTFHGLDEVVCCKYMITSGS